MNGLPTSPTAADKRQQQVDSYIDRLKDEFRSLLGTQYEYEQHFAQLQNEIQVFRKACNDIENERRLFEIENQALKVRIGALEFPEYHIMCLIDGDGTIFSPDILYLGQHGGRDAARKLNEHIRAYLSSGSTASSAFFSSDQAQLWVYIFYNKKGLSDALGRAGLRDARAAFDEFVIGFNQAGERFLMVDVGSGKEAADAKLRVHLDVQIRSPQTRKIFFGGCHDNGYSTTLRSIITAGMQEKIVLLPGYTEIATEIKNLQLPSLVIPDLFLAEKLESKSTTALSPSLSSASPVLLNAQLSGNVGTITPSSPGIPRSLLSYKSALQSQPATPSVSGNVSTGRSGSVPTTSPRRQASLPLPRSRYLNPNIPIWKHEPPPCTLFYLLDCKHGSECKYGHDYILDDDDYQTLRESAKKTPCSAVNNGTSCPFGEECLYGHVCPQGPKCYYLKLGKCKFVGEGMHS